MIIRPNPKYIPIENRFDWSQAQLNPLSSLELVGLIDFETGHLKSYVGTSK